MTMGAAFALVRWPGLPWIAAYLTGINLATITLYGWDKAASRRGRAFRVPENALHLFAFAGGTPGALAAQRMFRHKTVKGSFRLVFWAIALVQAALLAVALWRQGY
jgi:uncharacterized membrane protein YsdA (DUF1294 family)